MPDLRYDHLTDPDEALRVIADTRRRSPIAIGPYGPEVLSYDLVRTVLRDDRFITAKGLALDVKGITSGPLWDRATRSLLSLDGAVHHRLRRLVSKAFSPRAAERLRTLAARHHHRVGRTSSPPSGTATSSPTSPAATRRRVICALLGAPPEDWQLFSGWVEDIKKVFEWNVVNDAPTILAAFDQQDAYLEDLIARRRASLTDDLISDLIRAECDGDRLTHDELLMLCSGAARRRHRHHPQPARRRGPGVVRPPGSMGLGCPTSRIGARRGS